MTSSDPRWRKLLLAMEGGCGVYIVWAGDECLYIGKSACCKTRLWFHEKAILFVGAGADRVEVRLYRRGVTRGDEEVRLIKHHRPRFCKMSNPDVCHPMKKRPERKVEIDPEYAK